MDKRIGHGQGDSADSQKGGRFRFRHAVDVRFRDLDAMGHAHHSLVLIYLEEARAKYWREVAGRAGLDAIDYVLAEITVRYHRRIEYPQRLDIGVRTSRVGGKSFEQEFEIRSIEGERLASGRTVQVMYDYSAGESKAVPADIRDRIERFEERGPGKD
ncbi:MAG: acyl-CoA thioesterase [Longimicrobiales bacterium]